MRVQTLKSMDFYHETKALSTSAMEETLHRESRDRDLGFVILLKAAKDYRHIHVSINRFIQEDKQKQRKE